MKKFIAGLMLKNENRYIADENGVRPPYTMLEQVLNQTSRFADEIVIIDNNSTDGSKDVYRKYPKVVEVQENGPMGFDDVRDRSWILETAKRRGGDILSMFDGDEVISDKGVDWINQHIKNRNDVYCAKFKFVNLWRGRRRYRTDKWNNSYQFRLWSLPNLHIHGTALHNYGLTHSMTEAQIECPHPLIHYGWADWEHRLLKSMRYAKQHSDLYNVPIQETIKFYSDADLNEDGITFATVKPEWLSEYRQSICVVGMIYKSKRYLDFMVSQLKRYAKSAKYDVSCLIIANDPTAEIEALLPQTGIPYRIYRDEKPIDYYLNRVYRAWNFGGKEATGDLVVFVNSDFGYTEGWLDRLLEHYNSATLPCSRLVESGKLRSGEWGIERNFGRNTAEYNEAGFHAFANSIAMNESQPGGLFMPCVIAKDVFVKSGGYPEGNVQTPYGLISGDKFYFDRLRDEFGIQHRTAMDSIVYHIQEGEKDE